MPKMALADCQTEECEDVGETRAEKVRIVGAVTTPRLTNVTETDPVRGKLEGFADRR